MRTMARSFGMRAMSAAVTQWRKIISPSTSAASESARSASVSVGRNISMASGPNTARSSGASW